MSSNPLGKTVPYPEKRSFHILHRIPRYLGRQGMQLSKELPFCGTDEWNCYEFSWLNANGKPFLRILQLQIPADSPYLVESKSLKLYLSSYLQERFSSEEHVRTQIQADLSVLLETDAAIKLYSIDAAYYCPAPIQGACLDLLDISIDSYTYDPKLLSTTSQRGEETLYTHLFKSNCPVTGQPDFATVVIHYQGALIDNEALLRYLLSYRKHQEYHECCVERIFADIQAQCSPASLSVCARFTRRGGIDINPYRYTKNSSALPIARVANQ